MFSYGSDYHSWCGDRVFLGFLVGKLVGMGMSLWPYFVYIGDVKRVARFGSYRWIDTGYLAQRINI